MRHVIQLQDEDTKRLIAVKERKIAIEATLQAALDRCTALMHEATAEEVDWWRDMAHKYDFDITKQNWATEIDPKTRVGVISEREAPVSGAEILKALFGAVKRNEEETEKAE